MLEGVQEFKGAKAGRTSKQGQVGAGGARTGPGARGSRAAVGEHDHIGVGYAGAAPRSSGDQGEGNCLCTGAVGYWKGAVEIPGVKRTKEENLKVSWSRSVLEETG